MFSENKNIEIYYVLVYTHLLILVNVTRIRKLSIKWGLTDTRNGF